MTLQPLTQADFEGARARLVGRVQRTPTFSSAQIGAHLSLRLHLKAELLQKTGSFKVRGVLNKLTLLSPERLSAGLLSMSAGNHAAALAYGAQAVGTQATIVMPQRAVRSKIEASQGYGGEIVLTDGDLMEVVGQLERERGLELVHPFDDPHIMAGHGTIGLEILEDVPDVDTVVVPIGGGGLIGGIAAAIKLSRPDVQLIGVEPKTADAMGQAVAAGKPVNIGHPQTVADGLAAPFAGALPLLHVQRYVDRILSVDDATIIEALRWLITRAKLAAEPSGAATLAALLAYRDQLGSAERVVCLISGGNVDPAVLKAIL